MPKRKQDLQTKAALAKLRGCSRAAVTQATRPGGPLSEAVVGRQVDAAHEAVKVWLAAGDQPPTASRLRGSKTEPESPPDEAEQLGQAYRRMALRKREAEVRAIELKTEREAGSLIAKEGIRTHVFGALAALFKRLLEDLPETLALRLPALPTQIDRRNEIYEAISAELVRAKAEICRALDAGKDGSDDSRGS